MLDIIEPALEIFMSIFIDSPGPECSDMFSYCFIVGNQGISDIGIT